MADILQRGPTFFHSQCGAGRKILIEYVSANPTGPLHIAHGRGAVTGNVLARLLKVTGHAVTSEYYINDRGRQIDIMAESIHLRYGACLGREFTEPEDFYPGEYITEMAVSLEHEFGDKYLDASRDEWLPFFRERGVALMLERIKEDLADFGIEFDHWVSETALMSHLDMPALLEQLRQAGHIYEEDGKQWFRSTELGDDKDRVVVRDDGRETYFASDLAYHHDKAQRGFTELINIWGADHGGYIARVRAGLEACGDNAKALAVILVQMVRLSREGKPVRMGKRLGTAVWLRDVIDEAGVDATRYFFIMRRSDAQLDFDLELATRKSLDNPVYYAQMGHARLCSIARKAVEAGYDNVLLTPAALQALQLPEEMGLIKRLLATGACIEDAALQREPHRIVYFIQDLIAAFHSYYTQYKQDERVISSNRDKTVARLLLCRALQFTLQSLLQLLGVQAPEEMYLEPEKDETV